MRLIRLPPVVRHSLPGSWTDSRRSASSVVRPYRPLKTEPLASRRMSQARSASHSRAARSTTVLRTGGRSNVEPLMIFRTSLMAVCCSSASRVSSKRRPFSIAIAAWSANACTSSISRSLNGRTSYRDRTTAPIPRPSLSIGTPRTVFDFVSFATRELRSRSSWLTSGTWTVRASPSVTPMTPPSGPIGRQSPWAWPCARCRANSPRTAAGNSLLYERALLQAIGIEHGAEDIARPTKQAARLHAGLTPAAHRADRDHRPRPRNLDDHKRGAAPAPQPGLVDLAQPGRGLGDDAIHRLEV